MKLILYIIFILSIAHGHGLEKSDDGFCETVPKNLDQLIEKTNCEIYYIQGVLDDLSNTLRKEDVSFAYYSGKLKAYKEFRMNLWIVSESR